MEKTKSTVGMLGVVLGFMALCAAVLHFWAGPIEPPASVEEVVADQAVKIRSAVAAKLKGEKYQAERPVTRWGPDRVVDVATMGVALASIGLGVFGFVGKESARVAGVAAALGGSAIAVQFLGWAIGLIFLAILIAAVLGMLGLNL